MIKIKESDIRKQIKQYLEIKGWFTYWNLQGLGCYPGLSDLVAIKDGRTVHVEVKRPKGRQSDKQKKFQADIEAAGGEYVIAKCIEDLQEVGM